MRIQLIFSISVACLFVANNAFSRELFEVLERDGKHGYKVVTQRLEHLSSDNAFEGKYFKVVKEKSNEAISFDDELSFKAANVYYHLTIARDYWVNILGSKYVRNLPQMTVRLEITNLYSDLGHFANDNFGKKYNNAITIPAGKTPSYAIEKDKWGMEIWFNPMKKEDPKDLLNLNGNNPLAQNLELLNAPIVNFTRNSFTQSTLNHIFYPNYQDSSFESMLIRHAGTLALTYAIIGASRKLDGLFMQDEYYMDTAMVPEIIYHEFAHAAMAEYLVPSHSTPVIEGVADYFAARTSGLEIVYNQLKDYSVALEKNANSTALYNPFLERSYNATGDFALSLLWKVHKELDKRLILRLNGGNITSELIMAAATKLNTKTSNISHSLTRSLVDACKEICPTRGRMLTMQALLRVFEEKGI